MPPAQASGGTAAVSDQSWHTIFDVAEWSPHCAAVAHRQHCLSATSMPTPAPAKPNGRPRKNPGQGLPKRVQLRNGTFFYIRASDGKWLNLGKDLASAAVEAEAMNGEISCVGTMGHWLYKFVEMFKEKVEAGTKGDRTLKDYRGALGYLKPFFGHMHPTKIEPKHVQEYLDIGAFADRSVRVNREKACLSSCLTWMVARSYAGLKENVALKVARNPEGPRTRYITDDEYRLAHASSSPVVRCWMELIHRTLQRPTDILSWTRSKNLITQNGNNYLSFKQSKTGTPILIVVNQQLHDIFEALRIERKRQGTQSDFLVPREDGGQYTYDGLTSISWRYISKSGVKDFGIYDCKSKGATDMWLGGVPLSKISHLCGHKSEAVTLIYVKCRITEPVEINSRDLGLTTEPHQRKKQAKKGDGENCHTK